MEIRNFLTSSHLLNKEEGGKFIACFWDMFKQNWSNSIFLWLKTCKNSFKSPFQREELRQRHTVLWKLSNKMKTLFKQDNTYSQCGSFQITFWFYTGEWKKQSRAPGHKTTSLLFPQRLIKLKAEKHEIQSNNYICALLFVYEPTTLK